MKKLKMIFAALAAVSLSAAVFPAETEACSRIVYHGTDSLYIVGRSLDWKTPIPTNVYVYPSGMSKKGNLQPDAVRWTSRYGAVYAVGYDGGVTEGMNEKGLVINGLFCRGTGYENDSTKDRAPMSLAGFVAWLLDMNATTDEVVAALKKRDFSISGSTFDGGTVSTLHWGITDASGKSAILEFDHGAVNIYEGDDIRAMTNDPQWPDMQAINKYWEKIGGANMLPSTVKSPDRFVRADYFLRHVESVGDADLGLAITRSVLANLCVPYKYTVESDPNVSSTQWVSFSNVRDLRYYFHPVVNPGFFYIDLGKCDLRPGRPVMKLDVSKSADYIGEVNGRMKKSEPFTPMF